MEDEMRLRFLPSACVLLLAVGCDSNDEGKDSTPSAQASSADTKDADTKDADTKDADTKDADKGGASSGSAQYCDVRANEGSPNYGTCWEYPTGFPSPHLCAGYRGTVSTSPCPNADGYVGKCHFGAIDKTSKQGDATSTVRREEFFVYQYDVADVGPKLAAGRKAECEGEKGVWIPG